MKPMTDEEYLRVCEWSPYEGGESRALWYRHATRTRESLLLPIADALEAQLAEDRVRYNFVRERSEMHGRMLYAITDPR